MKRFDIVLALLGAIGALNIGIGILLTLEKIIERKLKPCWFYIYIILTGLGVWALQELLEKAS